MSVIEYYFVVPVEDDNTFFQGHNRGLVQAEVFNLLVAICSAPNETGEIYLNHAELIKSRSLVSSKNVSAVGSQFISELPTMIRSKVAVVFCAACHAVEIAALEWSVDNKVIVVSTVQGEGLISIGDEDYNPVHFLDHALDGFIREKFSESGPDLHNLRSLREPYDEVSPVPHYGSGVTLSNDCLFSSLGYHFVAEKSVSPSEPESYYDAICESVESLLDIVNADKLFRQEMIVYCPSIMVPYYNTNQHFWNQIFRDIKQKWMRDFIKNGLIRNPHYSGVNVDKDSIVESDNPLNEPAFSAVLQERQSELLVTNLFIGVLAAAYCSPVIRLPNSINLHLPQLKDLELAIQRSDPKSQAQLQVKFKKLSEQFRLEIGEKIGPLIAGGCQAIKLCSDVPVEWVYLDKLPLMISHEVSKLPMTPGNLLGQFCMLGSGVVIKEKALENILVIRSFQSHDKIKNMLQVAVQLFDLEPRLNVKFVDVRNTQEVISALNEYAGAIVVFDCHGGHDGENKPGFLRIGRDKLDVWSLFGVARIPPIVLLSACSTFAIGGSHASPANGFLRCGALSVIGTFLPVDAIKSSAFIARILYRIHSFLPALRAMKYEAINWRTFISGFLRMSYSTDVLKFFQGRNVIDEDAYLKIHLAANNDINLSNADWYGNLLSAVADRSDKSSEEILEMVKGDNPLFETMLYCQLGRPELITIILDEVRSENEIDTSEPT
jgi:hypothetical protein